VRIEAVAQDGHEKQENERYRQKLAAFHKSTPGVKI
jgi:hypothetical protein